MSAQGWLSKSAARDQARREEKRLARPHVQSPHVISFPVQKERLTVRVRNAFRRMVSQARRKLILSELDSIEQDLQQAAEMRERANMLEQVAYDDQAVLRAELRDLEQRPSHSENEQLVD